MRTNVSTKDLIEAYTIKHMTLRQMQDIYNMTPAGMMKRMKKAGITAHDGEYVKVTCPCGVIFPVTRSRLKASGNDRIYHNKACWINHVTSDESKKIKAICNDNWR